MYESLYIQDFSSLNGGYVIAVEDFVFYNIQAMYCLLQIRVYMHSVTN